MRRGTLRRTDRDDAHGHQNERHDGRDDVLLRQQLEQPENNAHHQKRPEAEQEPPLHENPPTASAVIAWRYPPTPVASPGYPSSACSIQAARCAACPIACST